MMVVGAGISGIRIALSLAEVGYTVLLIDKAPAIGGILTQLDYQFPNNHCGMCRILPMVDRDAGAQFCLRKGLFHENITLVPSSEVVSVSGRPGKLSITLKTTPTGIDKNRCTGCGDCEKACPVTVADLFNFDLSERKAVYLPVPHQIPNARVIDWDACTRCNACVDACPVDAIQIDNTAQTSQIESIGVVIFATGSRLFDPSSTEFYDMALFPNVVTATAFERIMSSSGPYSGKVIRPSDGKAIKRIAWIQCVGSRNLMIDADYCSRACCMFAVKEAVLAKEKIGPQADTAIFYMDMRTYGRDYQAYRDRAEHELGVRFIRCRVHSLEPGKEAGNLRITYVDSVGKLAAEDFDMVVLSTGQAPGQRLPEVARQEGAIVVDRDLGLRDISDSIIRAEVACNLAIRTAHASDVFPPAPDEPPIPASNLSAWKEKATVQIILCTCERKAIDSGRWDAVEKSLKTLPGNIQVMLMDSLCAQPQWDGLTKILEEGSANRLLLGACNPYVFLPKIKKLERETGIPASLVEVVALPLGVRKHAKSDVWIDAVLTEIEMALNRLRTRRIAAGSQRSVTKAALIVGGGPAGLAAASQLAHQAVDVFIVEKSAKLGGNLPFIRTPSARESIQKLMMEVKQHPRVTIHYETEVVRTVGNSGQFATSIRHRSGGEQFLKHGATILATGGGPMKNRQYGMGEHERIVSLFALEKLLDDPAFFKEPVTSVVMIQCVGSREEPYNYCSRVCCLKSLENALRIKERYPRADIYIFYRDMMTYGQSEKIYTMARKNGISFIPFELTAKPSVRVESGRVIVEGYHPILDKKLQLKPDWVSLATGALPHSTEKISKIFGIETTEHGFFKEADTKWRPVDSSREGVFICGLSKGPVRADEAIREGIAAAQRTLRILTKNALRSPQVVARVRHALCCLCESCIPVCPYNARHLDPEEGKIVVDTVACQACGACAVTCPNSAAVVDTFDEQGFMNALEAAV
jgi:heterodisulfide reductase subunit A